jgi:hypothetical protein
LAKKNGYSTMTTKDEELQNKFLTGMADASVDGIAYKKVFHALSTEPDFNLPINFADKVIKQIERKEAKSTAYEMRWLAAGIFLLFIGAVVGAVLGGFKPSFGAFKFWASYPGLFVFSLIFILLIQWLDKKWVKPRLT